MEPLLKKKKTIVKIMRIIRNSLEHAIGLELIRKNVTAKTKLLKGDKEELTVWNEQELQWFLKAAQDTRYFIVFHFALVTGMRQGEEYNDYGLVMCTPTGTAINPYNIIRSLNALVGKAAVLKIRFHDSRHTSVTLLINQGVHAKVLAERLGHENIKTTMNVYGHYIKTINEEAVKKFESLFELRDNA